MRVIFLHFVSKENWSLCADFYFDLLYLTRHICLGAKWARRACVGHWDWGGSRPPGKGRMAPPLGRKPVVPVTILLHPSWYPSFFLRVQSFSGLPLTPLHGFAPTLLHCPYILELNAYSLWLGLLGTIQEQHQAEGRMNPGLCMLTVAAFHLTSLLFSTPTERSTFLSVHIA